MAQLETTTYRDKNEYREHVQVYDTRTETEITLEAGSASFSSLAWLGLREGLGQIFLIA